MASKHSAILKLKASQAAAATRRRLKASNMEHMLIRQGAGLVAAAAIGVMNRNDVGPAFGVGPDKDDLGIPWKPLAGSVALIAAALTKGSVSAAFEGIALSSNAIYTERAISNKTLIAGSGI